MRVRVEIAICGPNFGFGASIRANGGALWSGTPRGGEAQLNEKLKMTVFEVVVPPPQWQTISREITHKWCPKLPKNFH